LGWIHGLREGRRFFEKWGKQKEMDSRDERTLRRAAIVEKWWHDKINSAAK
jgi:hypothetical protein